MTDAPPLQPLPPAARGVIVVWAGLVFLGFLSGEVRTAAGDLRNVWGFGSLGGLIVGAVYWHRYRGLGFLPYVLTAAAVAGVWAAVAGAWCKGTVAVASGCLAFAFVRSALFALRVSGWVGFNDWGLILLSAAFPFVKSSGPDPTPTGFAVLSSLLAVFAWYWFFRPWYELTCEPVLWWMYRIRSAGPGVREMPPVGPCLVVANHASWLDPLFLAKVLPRRTTPMMTSKFYDKPVIGWLVRRFGVIRVPEKAIKQDAPEIREAITALDRGECVVIFPEGFLRRSEEKPLKRFGRGVWQILCERPDTPVFAVWIEGAWGSYCSYWNGPPTKNKKPDRRRPIGVVVSAGVTVPADVLANHLATRVHLMNQVLGARTHLGLEALPAVELPSREEDAD